MSVDFYSVEPTLENYWRGVILFGKNNTSYKLALAKSFLEMSGKQSDFITLEELAEPYSRHTAEHLKKNDSQMPKNNSTKFFDGCKEFNIGKIGKDKLIEITVKDGFNAVFGAFHNLSSGEIPHRFFTDERSGRRKGIRLTDNLFNLLEVKSAENLTPEVEARWQLVETASSS